MTADQQLPTPADPEIVSTRLLDAPRAVVFGAFRDPALLAGWWGPKGFTNTFQEFDFRPGGAWRFVMHAPDGTDYPIEKEFVEIVPPERISVQHLQEGHTFRMTMTFADEAGKTRLAWSMRFESAEDAAKARSAVVEANEQNFDRLEARLARMTSRGEKPQSRT